MWEKLKKSSVLEFWEFLMWFKIKLEFLHNKTTQSEWDVDDIGTLDLVGVLFLYLSIFLTVELSQHSIPFIQSKRKRQREKKILIWIDWSLLTSLFGHKNHKKNITNELNMDFHTFPLKKKCGEKSEVLWTFSDEFNCFWVFYFQFDHQFTIDTIFGNHFGIFPHQNLIENVMNLISKITQKPNSLLTLTRFFCFFCCFACENIC